MYAAIAAAIAVPTLVILYFLKLKRRNMEISSTLLWKKAIQDLQANAPFQKLRRNILLFLQLLALAAAILALGQPQINSASLSGERQVIVIDRSASMNALDEDEKGSTVSRLEAAKKAALDLISGLREPGLLDKDTGDAAMVIAFDREASVVQQFTGDKRKLSDAVKAITPTDGPSLLEPAIRLARAQAPKLILAESGQVVEGISDRWPISLHVFTDGKIPDAERATPGPSDVVTFHRFGKPTTQNIGIVALRADREFDNPSNVTIFASIQSTEPTKQTLDAQLSIDGNVVKISGVEVPAAEAGKPANIGVVFTAVKPEGATIEVRLKRPGGLADDIDSFPTDDRGWIVIQPAKGLRIAVVTAGNLLLKQALATLPQAGEPAIMTAAEFQAELKTGKNSQYDVVVLDGVQLEWAGKKNALPPGRYLVLNNVPNTVAPTPAAADAANVPPLGPVLVDMGEGAASQIVNWTRNHPALRSLNLDNLDIFKSRLIDVPAGSTAQVMVESTLGPAMVELISTDMRAIVVPFDITNSDWPFDVSFLIFLSYATDYLGTGGGWAVARSAQPGMTISDRLPENSTSVDCKGPGNLEVGVGTGPDGSASFGPLPKVGVYTVRWTGTAAAGDRKVGTGASREYAVNLLDPAESDIRAAEEIKVATEVATAKPGDTGRAVRSIWPWMILAALLVVMLEWFVYNRKVHV